MEREKEKKKRFRIGLFQEISLHFPSPAVAHSSGTCTHKRESWVGYARIPEKRTVETVRGQKEEPVEDRVVEGFSDTVNQQAPA